MKNNTTIFKLILSLFLCSLLITGCLGKDRFDNSAIRYQMVEIPDYEISDYEDLLASENDVAKYNAICNLIKYAWDYAGILKKATTKNPDSKEKMPAKEEIEKANKVLSDIFTGLTDENENIKAASLIFLTEFSLNYSDKDMLYKQVEKVKAYSLRTQYEHIRALAILSNSETKIDKNLIETYLDSKSWLVANMTYLFLGKISCEEFHKDLISKYNNTDKEYNKLLILNAFSNAYNPESFLFIKNEILTSSSKKIKQKAIGILNKNNDKTQVAKWILNEHKTIDKTTLQAIFNEYYSQLESNTGTIFFDTLIISNKKELINKIDQNKFFAALYLAQEKQPKQNNLLNLEVKVQNSTLLNRAWMDFLDLMDEKELKKQEKKEREQEFEKTILPQYKVMLDVFHEDTKKLFLDAGMDKDEVEVFTKEIKELLQLLNKEKSK